MAAFVYSAISPMEHEINELTTQVPKWRSEIGSGKGTVGRLARDLHLSYYLSGTGSKSLTNGLASGALGAGKEVLSAVSSFLVVVILTVYFLAALPSIKRFSVHLVPHSRRERFSLLLDDVLAGVGGYLLANLFTSLVAGLGTYVWATVFGIPYSILLGLLVALFDLVPVVGSTIAGIIVSLVALSVSLPTAIATGAFYVDLPFCRGLFARPPGDAPGRQRVAGRHRPGCHHRRCSARYNRRPGGHTDRSRHKTGPRASVFPRLDNS